MWLRLIPFFIVNIIACIIISNPELRYAILIWTRTVLDSSIISYFLWLLSIGIGISYYFVASKGLEERKILIHAFGPFLDSTLTGMTYGALIQTSLTILSHLFNQSFFDEKHFVGFNNGDLIIIAFLMGYILYWSLMMLYRMGIDIFIVKDIGEIKKHISSQLKDSKKMDEN